MSMTWRAVSARSYCQVRHEAMQRPLPPTICLHPTRQSAHDAPPPPLLQRTPLPPPPLPLPLRQGLILVPFAAQLPLPAVEAVVFSPEATRVTVSQIHTRTYLEELKFS